VPPPIFQSFHFPNHNLEVTRPIWAQGGDKEASDRHIIDEVGNRKDFKTLFWARTP
jgi:hypothetical protein